MQWLQTIVDAIIARQPEGEITVESGASPSGTYHIGHLREIITNDAIVLELKRRGRQARHIHFVDDLDALRKVPVNVPAEHYEQYLGKPLCDIPAPDGSDMSYGDYFLSRFLHSAEKLGITLEVVYSHTKYREGYFTDAIERVMAHTAEARQALERISGRTLPDTWSPVQVMHEGYLKNRHVTGIDTTAKTITYDAGDGTAVAVRYDKGEVKLDWRLDWPARWWKLNIVAEPFGRDHASAGGSFDTGIGIMKDIFQAEAPIPVPYDFINRAGDTKKMSASKGTGIAAHEAVAVLPPEVIRYFILSAAPSKRLYFDQYQGTIRLVDEYAELQAKSDRTPEEDQLLYICSAGLLQKTVSRVPFSHLVASYQAALKDPQLTLAVIQRTEHSKAATEDESIITTELQFIDNWLRHWAPDDVKFELLKQIDFSGMSDAQQEYCKALAMKVEAAPADADGEYFHKAIYEFKDSSSLPPKELFTTLYKVLIGKEAGPRAGWFLSILPRDWLVARLRLEA